MAVSDKIARIFVIAALHNVEKSSDRGVPRTAGEPISWHRLPNDANWHFGGPAGSGESFFRQT